MNKPTLMPITTGGPHGKGMKQSTVGTGGVKSRSHEAKDSFGWLVGALF